MASKQKEGNGNRKRGIQKERSNFCRYFTTGTDPWGHYDINFFYL